MTSLSLPDLSTVLGLWCERQGILCQSTPTSNPIGSQQSQASQERNAPAGGQQAWLSSNLHSTSENAATSILDGGGFSATHGVRCARRESAVFVHQNLVHQQPTTSDTDALRSITATDRAIFTSTDTLEDIPGRCAYFLGSSSEQDDFLLDSFRYFIRRDESSLAADIVQVQPGSLSSSPSPENPVHFILLKIGHPEYVDRAKVSLSNAIEAKVWPHADRLVRLFFHHVHCVFPVVSKLRFLSRYKDDKTSIPACLRGAVYALASVFWSRDMTLQGKPMPFKQHELVDYTQQVLRREVENPNLFVLQACLLLQHVTPPAIDTMETPTTWTSAAQAVACAQMIGLHLEPGKWLINATERQLRRKLWWATFYADCWSSVCHGSPPHIAGTSYSTRALTMQDMRCDEEVPEHLQYLIESEDARFQVSVGARFLHLIEISRSLRTVLDCS